MKKIVVLILLFGQLSISACAQMCFEVVAPLKHLGSVSAKDVVNDNEGKPCAKVMIELPVEQISFSCPNIIGIPTKKTGRYECFVSVSKSNELELKVSHPNYGNIKIPLCFDGQSLISREAYHVKIRAIALESFAGKYAESVLDENHQTLILDISSLKTEKVYNMSEMFKNCSGLTSIDLSNFITINVNNMYAMFSRCSSLKSLNLSSFKTSNVTNMSFLFNYCSSLVQLDLSNFDTNNVTNAERMFSGCSNLQTIKVTNCNQTTISKLKQALKEAGILNQVRLIR